MSSGSHQDSYLARLLRALCSAVIPGVGQLVAGVKSRGFAMLGVFVVVTLAGVVILSRGTDAILSWAVQPKVLLGLFIVNLVIMLVRLIAVIDAWRTAKVGMLEPARPSRAGMATVIAGLVLILVLTLAPHVVAGYYTLVSRDLLTSVFAEGDGNASTSTLASTPPSTSTTIGSTSSSAAATSTDPSAGSTSTSAAPPTSGTTATSETTTTTVPLDLGGDDRISVLLIGLDEGYGREGARSDSMNVVSLDTATGKVAMFGIPRNVKRTPLGPKTAAALKMSTFPDILNALYGAAEAHPEIATDGGDPGAEAIQETAELILGIPIDYYVVVNMLGLADLVDAFGGVDIKLKTALHITYYPLAAGDGKTSYVFKVGVNHLNGLQALAFSRDRRDSNDYVRMGRQRCVLMGLLYQKSAASLMLRFPKIAAAIKKNVKTNIPIDTLPDLIRMRGDIKTDQMIALGFTPPDWVMDPDSTGHYSPNIRLITFTVDAILNDPDTWLASHKAFATAGSSECYAAGG
jgi:polyisoprenyl-teichoic acid--peptidoglycan teichoic acid transferase